MSKDISSGHAVSKSFGNTEHKIIHKEDTHKPLPTSTKKHKVRRSLDSDTGSEGDVILPSSPRLPPDGDEFPEEFADKYLRSQTLDQELESVSDSSDIEVNNASIMEELMQAKSLQTDDKAQNMINLFDLADQMEAISVDGDASARLGSSAESSPLNHPLLPSTLPPGDSFVRHLADSGEVDIEHDVLVDQGNFSSHGNVTNIFLDSSNINKSSKLPDLPEGPPPLPPPTAPPPEPPTEPPSVPDQSLSNGNSFSQLSGHNLSRSNDSQIVDNYKNKSLVQMDIPQEHSHIQQSNENKPSDSVNFSKHDLPSDSDEFILHSDNYEELVSVKPLPKSESYRLRSNDEAKAGNFSSQPKMSSTIVKPPRPINVPPLVLPTDISSNSSTPRSLKSPNNSQIDTELVISPQSSNTNSASPRWSSDMSSNIRPSNISNDRAKLNSGSMMSNTTSDPMIKDVPKVTIDSPKFHSLPRSTNISEMHALSASTDSLSTYMRLRSGGGSSMRSSTESLDSISSSGSFNRQSFAPLMNLSSTDKRHKSLLKTIEDRRKSTGTRLKGLQIPSRKTSLSTSPVALPTLASGRVSPSIERPLSPRVDLAKSRMSPIPFSTAAVSLKPIKFGLSPRKLSDSDKRQDGNDMEQEKPEKSNYKPVQFTPSPLKKSAGSAPTSFKSPQKSSVNDNDDMLHKKPIIMPSKLNTMPSFKPSLTPSLSKTPSSSVNLARPVRDLIPSNKLQQSTTETKKELKTVEKQKTPPSVPPKPSGRRDRRLSEELQDSSDMPIVTNTSSTNLYKSQISPFQSQAKSSFSKLENLRVSTSSTNNFKTPEPIQTAIGVRDDRSFKDTENQVLSEEKLKFSKNEAAPPLPSDGPPLVSLTTFRASPVLVSEESSREKFGKNSSQHLSPLLMQAKSPKEEVKSPPVVPKIPPPTLPRPYSKSPSQIHEVPAPKPLVVQKKPPPTPPKRTTSQKTQAADVTNQEVAPVANEYQKHHHIFSAKQMGISPRKSFELSSSNGEFSLTEYSRPASQIGNDEKLVKSVDSPSTVEHVKIKSSSTTSEYSSPLISVETRGKTSLHEKETNTKSASEYNIDGHSIEGNAVDVTLRRKKLFSDDLDSASSSDSSKRSSWTGDSYSRSQNRLSGSLSRFSGDYSRLSGDYSLTSTKPSTSRYSLGSEARFRSTESHSGVKPLRHPGVNPAQPASDLPTIEVELNKGTIGLGFCIEGGKDSPLGDKPIAVKRIFKGGGAALGVLEPGDEIVSANGKDFSNLSHYGAWNYLKALPEGAIKMLIRRKSRE